MKISSAPLPGVCPLPQPLILYPSWERRLPLQRQYLYLARLATRHSRHGHKHMEVGMTREKTNRVHDETVAEGKRTPGCKMQKARMPLRRKPSDQRNSFATWSGYCCVPRVKTPEMTNSQEKKTNKTSKQ